MAIGFTNRGKLRVLQMALQDRVSTGYFVALVTDTVAPNADTNLFSELEEIAAGNGYSSGGQAVARSLVGFPVENEDDAIDKSSVTMRDVFFAASGGDLPSSGDGISFVILTDNNPTISSREVLAFAEFDSPKTLSDTEILSILDLMFSLT